MKMKHSWVVAGLILAVAVAFGWNEDRKLQQVEQRLSKKRTEVAANLELHQEGEKTVPSKDRDEEAKRSGAELMKWLTGFRDPKKPGEPVSDEALGPMYDRLDRITAGEAMFVLNEYLEGRGLNGFPGPLLFNLCMTKLATDRPLEALGFFESFKKKWRNWAPLREMGTQVVGDAVIAMAKDDPDKAVEWLRARGKDFEGQISEHTKRVMLFHVAATDPAKALGLVGELGIEKSEAVASIVRAARTDEERMTMLAALRGYEKGLADDGMRERVAEKAFGAFGERLSAEGVQAMSKWVASAKLGGDEVESLVQGIVDRRKLDEPGPWIDWIGKTLSSEKADASVRALFSSWTETDYQAAGRWLVAMPVGPVREMTVQAYAEKAAKYDPETAAQWSETLPAGKRREDTIRNVHAQWPKDEPADAKAADAFAKRNGIE